MIFLIHFLLCDDDAEELHRLERLIYDYYGERAQATLFSDSLKALEYVQQGGACDVAILDIIMPSLTGTRLASMLRSLGFTGTIIFLTTSREYGPESYDVGALDYILKPIDASRLNTALAKLEEHMCRQDNAGMVLTVGREARRVLFRDILYAEAGDHIVGFGLESGETLTVRGNFRNYLPILLADSRFARCHGSFVLNMDKVHALNTDRAVLTNGKEIPVGQRYTGLRKQYMKWLMREEEA